MTQRLTNFVSRSIDASDSSRDEEAEVSDILLVETSGPSEAFDFITLLMFGEGRPVPFRSWYCSEGSGFWYRVSDLVVQEKTKQCGDAHPLKMHIVCRDLCGLDGMPHCKKVAWSPEQHSHLMSPS